MPTREEAQRSLRRKAGKVMAFMNSELGKEIIKAMEDEFYHGDLRGEDPHQTYYNLGRRDAVSYLKELQSFGEKQS